MIGHILLAATWCFCACLEVCCSLRANSPEAQCSEGQVFMRQAIVPYFNWQLILLLIRVLAERPHLTTMQHLGFSQLDFAVKCLLGL